MENAQSWTTLIKSLKETAITQSDSGDLAPIVLLERGDRIKTIIESPIVDKNCGYFAIHIARKLIPFDALSFVVDAHIAFADASNQEGLASTLEQYKPGEMQRICDEENACERGLITDVMVASRFCNGNTRTQIIPYSYHGKESQLIWLDNQERYASLKEMSDEAQISGESIETIQCLLKEPSVTGLDGSTEKKAFQILTEIGFKINLVDLSIPA